MKCIKIINRSNKYEWKWCICIYTHTYMYREREKIVGRYNVSFACVFIYGYH